nr:MAG TPA: hypothetical protein [Caudoviricetes sp.]
MICNKCNVVSRPKIRGKSDFKRFPICWDFVAYYAGHLFP